MIRAMLLILLLSGCGASPLKLLTGGGPNVAANVQAGKTNTQTLGTTEITEQKLVRPQARTINQTADDNQVRAEKVDTVVVNEGIKPWHILAFIAWSWALYELPAPRHIRRWIGERWDRRG